MIWTPEQSKIPQHFCLLVKATASPPEPAPVPSTPDPVNDRRWAQYNLQAVALPPSKKLVSVFWAENPEGEPAAFSVTVRAVSEADLKTLARVVKAEPVAIRNEQLALHRLSAEPNVRASHQASVVIELNRGERQPLVVSADALELASHQFTAIEAVQSRLSVERGDGTITGSLGILLFAADKSCKPGRVGNPF
jgi:hypothetical protein